MEILIMKIKKSILTMSKPIYDTFVIDDGAYKWSNDVDQYEFNDACDESSSEDIYEFNRDFNLYKIFANTLFQSKEDKELGSIEHVPPRHNFYFDENEYCRDFNMFINPCYESSLNHDDLVIDIKVYTGDIKLFDKFINHPFKVQTLNPKSNSVNTFIITGKAYVGWHVLEGGDRFFLVLINHFSTQYTSVGCSSTHKFIKPIKPACKACDVFLYTKFHPTRVQANGFFPL
jgi:hypothetical protein